MPEADWFGFCPAQPPDFSVVEMDVVEGAGWKDGNIFLTQIFERGNENGEATHMYYYAPWPPDKKED